MNTASVAETAAAWWADANPGEPMPDEYPTAWYVHLERDEHDDEHDETAHVAGSWAEVRAQWHVYVTAEAARAAEACRGCLLRADRVDEFLTKYGYGAAEDVLFGNYPSGVAYRYASEELLGYWDEHPRTTWPEFAVSHGIRYGHYVRQAAAAPAARRTAAHRAWRSLHLTKKGS